MFLVIVCPSAAMASRSHCSERVFLEQVGSSMHHIANLLLTSQISWMEPVRSAKELRAHLSAHPDTVHTG